MFHKNFKSSKTKDFRKQIARILNIIKENRKEEVIKGLREDLRSKLTRAMKRKMTKLERKLATLK